jgi:hypothetical protein
VMRIRQRAKTGDAAWCDVICHDISLPGARKRAA